MPTVPPIDDEDSLWDERDFAPKPDPISAPAVRPKTNGAHYNAPIAQPSPPQANGQSTSIQRGRKVGRLTLLTDYDAQHASPRDYYLKGLISPGEMSVIYGEPGCGKSFFALYIVRAIAQGRMILGRRVRATSVLFLALEGVAGFENRLRAQIITHEESDAFGYIAQPVDLFTHQNHVADVISAGQLMSAGLIVIDTLNRAISGGSENDPADMGLLIKNIDAIRAATGAHILVIHHSGKDASKGMRGHSSLLGAADMVMDVKRGEKGQPRTVTVPKAKDDADGAEFAFHLKVLEMGIDQDGDAITTCLVEECENGAEAPPTKRTIPAHARLALDQLQNCLIDLGVKHPGNEYIPPGSMCVTADQWRDYLLSAQLINSGGNYREQFKRLRVTLGDAGAIRVWNDYVFTVTSYVPQTTREM